MRDATLPVAAAPSRRGAVAPFSAVLALALSAPLNEADVCALGVVRTDDEALLPQQRIPDGVRSLALQCLGLAMAASSDPRQRGAKKLLRARLAVAPDALADAADADAACRRARDSGLEETARFCVEDQARSQAALLAPAAAAGDPLARLDALSSDPLIHAFAFDTCAPGGPSLHGGDGNCQLISADEWARIAPDDAEPWLRIAAQALARGDAPAASAALARAAQARAIGRYASAPQSLACDSLQRRREWVLLAGRLGEIGAGRELLRRERSAARQARAP